MFIPAGARAIVTNVAVVDGTAQGSLLAYPGHVPTPLATTIFFPAS